MNNEKTPDRTSEELLGLGEDLSLGELAQITELGIRVAHYDARLLERRLCDRGVSSHLALLGNAIVNLRSAAADVAAGVTAAFTELAHREIDKVPEYPKEGKKR